MPLVLFGSQARGEATGESDVDVLAILPDLSPRALDLAWEAGLVISLILAAQEEWEEMSVIACFDQEFTPSKNIFRNDKLSRRLQPSGQFIL